ncbi:PHP domain-containing protein [Halococcoides cellulosivorans]|uniref:Histidinol-phosphatase n=1 Tax=Halococcoides cellulosivorans TaxID=1679096 RepID=A0A2R4X3E8_9EURY|nr:PHP-associated domain-containing protein [Halococcoides cellulosivorans]AWB28322.1 histidinol-phosphatase [Halococcoides cellulosivorans]
MFTLDLHTHSRFFHGFESRPTAFDPVGARLIDAVARGHGLDGVALTNHDYNPDLSFDGIVTIPGIEISTTQGHVLVIGADPPTATDPGAMTPEAVIDLAAERDCATIIAHPFRDSTVRGVDAPFDAVELNGKHPRNRAFVERIAREREIPIVGGSDAHYPVEVGRAYTAVDADELTPASVVAAIRDGRVEARISEWPPHDLLRRVYRRLHRSKGVLETPTWDSEHTDRTASDGTSGPNSR